jgi:hypothetical protein
MSIYPVKYIKITIFNKLTIPKTKVFIAGGAKCSAAGIEFMTLENSFIFIGNGIVIHALKEFMTMNSISEPLGSAK